METILDELAATLSTRFGRAIEVVRTDAGARTIRFPGFEAIVGVAIDDPARPSFSVTYPRVEDHHTSLAQAQEVRADGVILAGLVGIVTAVAEHGCVVPEFPGPQLRKQLRR